MTSTLASQTSIASHFTGSPNEKHFRATRDERTPRIVRHTNQIRATVPTIQEEGPASPAKVHTYFVEKYEGLGLGLWINSVPRADGGVSVRYGVRNHPNILYIADVSPMPTGSKTVVYENSLAVYDRDRAIIRYCAAGKY